MDTSKIIKLVALNIGIVLFDIVILSHGLLGGLLVSALGIALKVTAIFMSIVVFIYGNYKLLTEKQKIVQTSEIQTLEDYENALRHHRNSNVFGENVELLLEQIERMQKKKETILDILLQKFDAAEMSYKKFESVILEVEKIFYMNIRSVLNKLNAFDEDDYDQIKQSSLFSEKFMQDKLGVYSQYITFVKSATEENEQILLKLDKLLFEISKFDSLESGEIENLAGMQEIDALIKQTKYYR